MVKWVWEKNVIGSWNVLSVISENYVFICVFCESLAGPGFAPVLGGIAIALLEVARFMVMRLIASIIIQGVPISFSSLPAATFYFVIVKSELQFSRSGDIAITYYPTSNKLNPGGCGVTSNNGKMAKDMASPKQQQLQQLRCVLSWELRNNQEFSCFVKLKFICTYFDQN